MLDYVQATNLIILWAKPMNNLIHRSCSNCVYWAENKYNINGVMMALCEKLINPSKIEQIATKGSDKCGQWKKLKYQYDYRWDEMRKDYR